MGFTQDNYQQASQFFQHKDPKIHQILIKHGYLQPVPKRNLFAILVGSIIGQKIKFKLAQQQRGKLYTQLDTDNFTIDEIIVRGMFHLQDRNITNFCIYNIINKGFDFLNEIDIDLIRSQTIKNLVTYLIENNIQLTSPNQLDDLLIIKGIGDWTLTCTKIMYSLNADDHDFNDSLLYQDLIIRRGIQKLYNIKDQTQIIQLSQSWSPWKGIVTWYLWKEFT